jgi:HSP20 family molecular chaperone IbpA
MIRFWEGIGPFELLKDIRFPDPISLHMESFHTAHQWKEENDCFTIEIELPGVKKEETILNAQNETLRLEYTKNEKKHSKYIILPKNVNADEITAIQIDGVISITAPKADAVKSKTIKIS